MDLRASVVALLNFLEPLLLRFAVEGLKFATLKQSPSHEGIGIHIHHHLQILPRQAKQRNPNSMGARPRRKFKENMPPPSVLKPFQRAINGTKDFYILHFLQTRGRFRGRFQYLGPRRTGEEHVDEAAKWRIIRLPPL